MSSLPFDIHGILPLEPTRPVQPAPSSGSETVDDTFVDQLRQVAEPQQSESPDRDQQEYAESSEDVQASEAETDAAVDTSETRQGEGGHSVEADDDGEDSIESETDIVAPPGQEVLELDQPENPIAEAELTVESGDSENEAADQAPLDQPELEAGTDELEEFALTERVKEDVTSAEDSKLHVESTVKQDATKETARPVSEVTAEASSEHAKQLSAEEGQGRAAAAATLEEVQQAAKANTTLTTGSPETTETTEPTRDRGHQENDARTNSVSSKLPQEPIRVATGQEAPVASMPGIDELVAELEPVDSQVEAPIGKSESAATLREQILRPGQRTEESGMTRAENVRFVNRVARAFESAQSRGEPVRIRLNPPELGAIRLEVKVEASGLVARVETETTTAKTALLDNLAVLKDRLSEQGMKIEQFDVDVTDRQPEADRSEDEQRRRRRSQDAQDQTQQNEPGTTPSEDLDDDNLNVVV